MRPDRKTLDAAVGRLVKSVHGEDQTEDYWRDVALIVLDNGCTSPRGHHYGELGGRCLSCGAPRED